MRLGLALCPPLALVAGCSGAAPLLTADKLLAQCEGFKGKRVQLAGYLGECAGNECHLAIDKSRWDAFVVAFNGTRGPRTAKSSEAWSRAIDLWPIIVGGDQAFDRKASPLQNSYVVITGRIAEANCTGLGGTDRSAGIEPTDIRAWTSSEGAPVNTH